MDKPVNIDTPTIAMLLKATKDPSSNVRADAISFLARTHDPKYADLYLEGIDGKSNQVRAISAYALGRSGSPKAYDRLMKMAAQDSWRQNARRAGLDGLAELTDKRLLDVGLKYANDKTQPMQVRTTALRIVAANGKGDARAYPLIYESFKKALDANNFNAMFDSLTAIAKLSDPRGQEAFDAAKAKFKDNKNLMEFIGEIEGQFKEAMKK